MAAGGESSELAALFTAIRPQLRRFVIGVTKDPHAAEDAMQAAFAKAIEACPAGGPEALKAWFFKVAFHEALAARRKTERSKRAVKDLRWLQRPPVEFGLEERDEMQRVQREIDRLPVEQKFVLRERFVAGKTFAKIAEEQRLPIGTVLTRMRLAMERLKSRLKD